MRFSISCQSFISILVFLFSLPLIQAQDEKQRFEGVQIPHPGNSVGNLLDYKRNLDDNIHRSETTSIINFPQNIYTVTTTADDGPGSLREAILLSNVNSGSDIINFSIPGTGIKVLTPLTPLPDILYPVVLDGTTQSGYSEKPLIEIDGIWAGPSDGIAIKSAGCTLTGIAVNRFNGVGIAIYSGQTTIQGCFIGLDPDGITNKGNLQEGLFVLSANNFIGSPSGKRNIISGNDSSGIFIAGVNASGNKIQNTFIGTDFNGSSAVPNKLNGITIYQSSQCTIGGSALNEMNVISGNLGSGIRIEGGAVQNIIIKGNRIGTNAEGSSAIPNFNGVTVINGAGTAAGNPSNIIIGGKWSESKNLISGNNQVGVAFFMNAVSGGTGNVIAGNLIGTNYTGAGQLPNNHGIYITRSDTSGNMPGIKIGGSITDSNNVIAGNLGHGIWIRGNGARNNQVYGNHIGTTAALDPLGNGLTGIFIDSASFNYVGNTQPLRGNIIGDNYQGGISIIGNSASARGNNISKNFIGEYEGTNVGNRTNGIYIEANDTKVGGPGAENIIGNNYSNGIFVYSGIGNVLYGNSIFKNGTLGIDLFPNFITKNDSGDVDLGPNLLQNFPLLDSIRLLPDKIVINSTFYSKPNSSFTLHFYRSNSKSPSHFGEGQEYMDSVSVVTNDSGWAFLNVTLNRIVYNFDYISALAVDAEGNTSEFSRAYCLMDSDGDGLYDCWETAGDGIDINADGLIDLDLYSRGARSYHKDIFIEIDYMLGFRPSEAALNMVRKAFSEIPNKYLNNPDRAEGIKLTLEISDTLQNELLPGSPWPRFFEIKSLNFGSNLERQHPNAKYLLEAKRLAYRYCLWANRWGNNGNSGLAELTDGAGGNDFLITLGSFTPAGGDSNQQAGTFMHELGHTLGLHHGGDDDINFKPNYYSVMNYTWQFPDTSLFTDLSWRLVYSNAALPTLNENSLNEAIGLNPPAEHYPDSIIFPFNVGITDTAIRKGLLAPNVAVDWDGNGDSTGFSVRTVDINWLDPGFASSPGEILIGYSDLQNLKFNFRNSPKFRDPTSIVEAELYTEPEEMTPETYNYLQSLQPYGVVPPVTVSASIRWLGNLGGTESIATGISDDGRVVVGQAEDSIYNAIAFRWTPWTGMQSLGNFGNYPVESSEATGISADGQIIVGWSYDNNNIKRAFRWTEATGMVDLGLGQNSEARAISGDGTTIVGWALVGNDYRAFVYKNGTASFLGTLGGSSSYATAVSYDGSVVAGHSDNPLNYPYAFRWTEAGGMQNIGVYYSFANGISGDGNTITGYETWSGTSRAFRWSLFDGMQLNYAGNFSEGTDVSEDGKYVVGYSANGAFRKSISGQMELYNQILSDSLTPGSDLYGLTAITSDGRYAVGYGYNSAIGDDDAFFLDTGGRLITSVEVPETKVPKEYFLEQNYPNPFNPVTTIRFSIPNFQRVVITVYNILGQRIYTLMDEEKSAGSYEVRFNAKGISSGVYFYQLRMGDFVETKKMVLMR